MNLYAGQLLSWQECEEQLSDGETPTLLAACFEHVGLSSRGMSCHTWDGSFKQQTAPEWWHAEECPAAAASWGTAW